MSTIKEYYKTYAKGYTVKGYTLAPRISQSETELQYLVPTELSDDVIKHLADHGITQIRSAVFGAKTAIAAK